MQGRNVLEMLRLDGKVALVTGGSKGLGKAMAQGLAEAGAVTVVCSRDGRACEAAAEEIRECTGRQSLAVAGDVTDEESVAAVFRAVLAAAGALDVLVNSAGVNVRHPVEAFSLEDYRRVLETNLTGSWLCCREAGRVMRAAGRGSVINIGSALSAVGLPERSAYCSSKAGIIGLTRTLALEWAPLSIRCNAICPGPFLTEINRPLLDQPEKAQAVVGQTALGRWAELDEIKGAAVFLASDAASYVTGASLFVDGGWTAG